MALQDRFYHDDKCSECIVLLALFVDIKWCCTAVREGHLKSLFDLQKNLGTITHASPVSRGSTRLCFPLFPVLGNPETWFSLVSYSAHAKLQMTPEKSDKLRILSPLGCNIPVYELGYGFFRVLGTAFVQPAVDCILEPLGTSTGQVVNNKPTLFLGKLSPTDTFLLSCQSLLLISCKVGLQSEGLGTNKKHLAEYFTTKIMPKKTAPLGAYNEVQASWW